MSNPRPCKWCLRPESVHQGSLAEYEPAKRTKPLRARRLPGKSGTWPYDFDTWYGPARARLPLDYAHLSDSSSALREALDKTKRPREQR